MLLAIDAGNTNITFAVFKDKEIIAGFRTTTATPRTSDEYGLVITNLLELRGIKKSEVKNVIISSVVPNIMHSLNNAIIKYFGIDPIVVGPGIKTGIKLVSPNPHEIGSDRIVNVVAGYELYGGPVIVIDFGTATTYDFVTEDAVFLAGVTCPGISLSAKALWQGAAKIPEIEIVKPSTILAKDTISSIQAGLVYGCVGQTEYIIEKIKEEYGMKNIKVVATGGLGRTIAEATDKIDLYDPDITMHGLRIIFDKCKK